MSTTPLFPHTDAWFDRLRTVQPDLSRKVKDVVEHHGKNCWSVCGDTPEEIAGANDQQETLPSHPMRFCDECLPMQPQLHQIPWIKMAEQENEEGENIFMPRTWQTDEVIRQLADADLDELQEVFSGTTNEAAAETLKDWIREGNAPRALSHAVMRFTRAPDHSFDPVDWKAVVGGIREASDEDQDEDF